MSRFWKFNSFVAMVGVALVVIAFFMGEHSFAATRTGTPDVFLSLKASNTSLVVFLAGVGSLAYTVLVTLMGLIAGFFRAPEVQTKR